MCKKKLYLATNSKKRFFHFQIAKKNSEKIEEVEERAKNKKGGGQSFMHTYKVKKSSLYNTRLR